MKRILIIFSFVGICLWLPLLGEGEDQTSITPQLRVDETPLDRSTQGRSSYADVLESAIPAVISVSTAKIINVSDVRLRRRHLLEDFLRHYYGLPDEERPPSNRSQKRKVPSGMGSGVIVTPDGYILTNYHVITIEGKQADEVTVILKDGRDFEAKVVGADSKTDVAVLKIDAQDLPYVTLADSNKLRVGDVIFAVGNPLRVGITVTGGIISATQKTNLGILGIEGYENFIQVDAPINLGNSGGALLDAQGRLIGINTAILSRSGGNIGIGFAIPINLAKRIMVSLIETGTVKRGLLGVRIKSLDEDLVAAFGLSTTKGALIHEVQKGLPADIAGLRHGDVIISLDDQPVDSAEELRLSISQMPPQEQVKIGFIRNGEEKTVTITLAALENGNVTLAEENRTSGLQGVTLTPLNPELRRRYGIEDGINGLLITDVAHYAPYREVLRVGMVITEVNGEAVETLSYLGKQLKSGYNRLYVWMQGNYAFIAIQIP